VKSKMLAVVAIAAGVSLAACGTTTSASLSDHTGHLPQQATGEQLMTRLLPVTAFGSAMKDSFRSNTGKYLKSTQMDKSLSNTSCGRFEAYFLTPAFGKTAQAMDGSYDSKPDASTTNVTTVVGFQYVSQFANAQAASTFFGQARAKYVACKDFTWPAPETDNPEYGNLHAQAGAVINTTVGPYKSYWFNEKATYAKLPTHGFDINTLVTLSGKYVYLIYVINSANLQPSHALMLQLISRVQNS
jgi:hypothetical protein